MSPDLKMNAVEEVTGIEKKLDDATFEIAFKKHFVPLCAYCHYKFGFDTDLAKDVVQGSFLKLWEARPAISNDLTVKAYLYKIIINSSLDILRKEKKKQDGQKDAGQRMRDGSSSNGIDQNDYKQLSNEIDQAISELPEQMRRIFQLCRFEGLKYREVADRLGISVKTVETQMSRALLKLRDKLSAYLLLWIALMYFIQQT